MVRGLGLGEREGEGVGSVRSQVGARRYARCKADAPRLSEAEAAFTPLSCALSGPAYRSRFALPYC